MKPGLGKANEAMSKAVMKTAVSRWEGWEAVYPKLFAYSLMLTRNRTDAEDITQETLLYFKEHMEKNHWEVEIENIESYLRRIARNLYIDLSKRRKKERQVSYDDEESMQTHTELDRKAIASDNVITRIEDAILYKKLMRSLPMRALLSGLNERELKLLYMKSVEERTPEEIADIMGEEKHTIRYDLNRLHAKLRYRVRKIGGEFNDIMR